jgi:hypothetical protein
MVRNSTLNTALQTQQQSNFKTVNNLLTLQDNHVEEFFQYHGEEFFVAFDNMIEDIIQRVVSNMLSKLEFILDPTTNHMVLQSDCLSEYQKITQENIQLDIQTLLGTAVNSEVIMQRKLAKQSYLEAQGFTPPANTQNAPMGAVGGTPMMGVGAGMQMSQGGYTQGIQGMNTAQQTGYPVAPVGYDNSGNAYWIDEQTGQMTYTPPNGGLGLMKSATKIAAWAKWLA